MAARQREGVAHRLGVALVGRLRPGLRRRAVGLGRGRERYVAVGGGHAGGGGLDRHVPDALAVLVGVGGLPGARRRIILRIPFDACNGSIIVRNWRKRILLRLFVRVAGFDRSHRPGI